MLPVAIKHSLGDLEPLLFGAHFLVTKHHDGLSKIDFVDVVEQVSMVVRLYELFCFGRTCLSRARAPHSRIDNQNFLWHVGLNLIFQVRLILTVYGTVSFTC